MSDAVDLDGVSLSQRVVALSLAALADAGETPAHTAAVNRACSEHVGDVDAEAFGRMSEADVNRALNALQDHGLVTARGRDAESPVGKGRPTYALAVARDQLLTALAADDRFATAIDGLSAERA
jgi:DNA-binding PadR family transcriptional regulator